WNEPSGPVESSGAARRSPQRTDHNIGYIGFRLRYIPLSIGLGQVRFGPPRGFQIHEKRHEKRKDASERGRTAQILPGSSERAGAGIGGGPERAFRRLGGDDPKGPPVP